MGGGSFTEVVTISEALRLTSQIPDTCSSTDRLNKKNTYLGSSVSDIGI